MIRAIHLLTDIDSYRERMSIGDIGRISNIDGVNYGQIINDPYIDYPPIDSCLYPDRVGMVGDPSHLGLVFTPGTYGCFMAHKNYIMGIDDPKDDEIYLIFESDAKLNVKPNKFINLVHYAKSLMVKNNIDIFNFGIFLYSNKKTIWEDKITHIESNLVTGTHCYMLLKDGVLKLQESFMKEKWQAYDFWLSEQCNIKFGLFNEPLCSTYPGNSLIDKSFI